MLLVAAFAISGAMLAAGDAGAFAVFAFVLLGWVISLCLHEWGHAVTAYWGGDRSVEERGYLTLNPLRYTNPLLSIVLPLLILAMGGIGFPGGSVYVHTERIRGPLWRAAMSAAGPALNLACLVLIGLVFQLLGDGLGGTPFAGALALLAFLQATALVLNLLPVPGLDGFGILQAFLPDQARMALASLAQGVMMLFLIVIVAAPQLLAPLWGAAFALCDMLSIDVNAIRTGLNLFRFWDAGSTL
jgi:Zn-dependent protease